jgi:hypothetical protein
MAGPSNQMVGSGIHGLQTVEASLKHPGTGRLATVLRIEDLESTSPVAVAAGKYVLVIASDRQTIPLNGSRSTMPADHRQRPANTGHSRYEVHRQKAAIPMRATNVHTKSVS